MTNPPLGSTSLSWNNSAKISQSKLSSGGISPDLTFICLFFLFSSGHVHLPAPIDPSIPCGLLPLSYDSPCVPLHMAKGNWGRWLPTLRR